MTAKERREAKERRSKLKANEILALDIATKTGYYSLNDGGGVWNFDTKAKGNSWKQYAAFRQTLVRYIKTHNIKQIVAEDVNVAGYFNSMRKLSEFRGIMREVSESLDLLPPVFVNVTSVKFFMTGKGKASKSLIINACKKKYNIEPVDDNHADAIGVFYYFLKNPNKK